MLRSRPDDLPDFLRPPLVEVAVGVQFDQISGFQQGHLGVFWDQVRESYPKTIDQPRVETAVESLDATAGPGFRLQVGNVLFPSRALFLDQSETYLLQVQDDRFLQNWRWNQESYPHFEDIASQFVNNFSVFEEVVRNVGLGEPSLRQVELSYINWVPGGTSASVLATPLWRPSRDNMAQAPDAEMWNSRFLVKDGSQAIGRLSIESGQARRIDGPATSDGFQLTLVFRAPLSPRTSQENLEDLMFRGRRLIVETFVELTSPERHAEWGLK